MGRICNQAKIRRQDQGNGDLVPPPPLPLGYGDAPIFLLILTKTVPKINKTNKYISSLRVSKLINSLLN